MSETASRSLKPENIRVMGTGHYVDVPIVMENSIKNGTEFTLIPGRNELGAKIFLCRECALSLEFTVEKRTRNGKIITDSYHNGSFRIYYSEDMYMRVNYYCDEYEHVHLQTPCNSCKNIPAPIVYNLYIEEITTGGENVKEYQVNQKVKVRGLGFNGKIVGWQDERIQYRRYYVKLDDFNQITLELCHWQICSIN